MCQFLCSLVASSFLLALTFMLVEAGLLDAFFDFVMRCGGEADWRLEDSADISGKEVGDDGASGTIQSE